LNEIIKIKDEKIGMLNNELREYRAPSSLLEYGRIVTTVTDNKRVGANDGAVRKAKGLHNV
jgi:hypothetical protein